MPWLMMHEAEAPLALPEKGTGEEVGEDILSTTALFRGVYTQFH